MSQSTKHPAFILKEQFTIMKLQKVSDALLQILLTQNAFFCLSNDETETTVICDYVLTASCCDVEEKWVGLKLVGPIPFSVAGLLNEVLTPIAQAGVSVLVVSTFSTDIIFFKSSSLQDVLAATTDVLDYVN